MIQAPKVAMMQPHFLPWLGFFELLAVADVFVILDDFQFQRQSWGHRNRIFTQAGQVGFVTMPVEHGHAGIPKYNEVAPAPSPVWRKKFIATFDQVYGKTPGHAQLRKQLLPVLDHKWENLADLNLTITEIFCEQLGLDPFIVKSSEIHVDPCLTRSKRIRAMLYALKARTYYAAAGSFDYMDADGGWDECGVDVRFQDHHPVAYEQYKAVPFQSRLSALDAICRAPSQVQSLIYGTGKWLSLDDKRAKRRSADSQSEGVLMSTLRDDGTTILPQSEPYSLPPARHAQLRPNENCPASSQLG